MRQSASIIELTAALSIAQGQIKNPEHNKNNPYFNSKYADLPTVIECMKIPFAENGLSLSQSAEYVGDKIVLVTRIMHKSGEWLESDTPIIQCTGKNATQELAKAITFTRRYALSSILNVSSEPDNDANIVDDKPSPAQLDYERNKKQKQNAAARQQPQLGYDAHVPDFKQVTKPEPAGVPNDHIEILVNDMNLVTTVNGLKDLLEQANNIRENMTRNQKQKIAFASYDAKKRLGL